MPYNFVADSFYTEKLCSRLFFNRSASLHRKWTFCVFEPSLGAYRCKERWSSLAHYKARSGLSISVNCTFFAKCYGWGATSEYRFKIGDFAPTGAGWP